MGANPGFTTAPNTVDSAESSSSSHLAPIWIGVAVAIAIAIAVACKVYRSTTQHAAAFEAMMNTAARVEALDHARADRTLLAVDFQTYQLGSDRSALNALAPLAGNLKGDLERIRTLSVRGHAQQHRLDQIDSQPFEFDRLFSELTRIGWKAQPHKAQRPTQMDAAAQAAPSPAPFVNSNEARLLRGATKVLVLDDDAVIPNLLAEELAVLGFHADVVKNEDEAFECFARERHYIVLMDVSMPHTDGCQAAAEIRRREKGAPRAIIIAFSAYPNETVRRRADGAGMDDHLAKPA